MSLKFLRSRKLRQGSVATLITVSVVAVIVVLNMVATALTDRYGLTLDMTSNKMFTLSDETVEFLDALDKDVVIYVLAEEDYFSNYSDYYKQANEVIRNYERQSRHVDVVYYDIDKDPTFKNDYQDLQLVSGMILVDGPNGATTLSAGDLFTYTSDPTYGGYISSQAEQSLTSAILNVTSEEKVRVTVLTGHGEEDVSAFTAILEKNNYEVITQNLLTESLDPEATIAILAAPTSDFTEDELRRLDQFLDNGGSLGKLLLYFAAVDAPELPTLNAFLSDWGIGVGTGLIQETSYYTAYNFNPNYAFVNYAEDEYSAGTLGKEQYCLIPDGRPLSALFESRSSRTVSVLLEYFETAQIQEGGSQAGASSGNMPALILTSELTYDSMTPLYSHVLAASSYRAVGSDMLSIPSVANSEYFINLLNELTGKGETIRIQDKTFLADTMGLRDSQFLVLAGIFLILVPLLTLVAGLVVWLGRRHR